jgi:uncharacterized protein YigA (DUF484 family)
MDAESVARYLQDNPVFFEQYADLLSRITLVHPHGDHTIALADRQLLALRDRSKSLEAKLAELIRFGEENDAIGEKMHRLCVALLEATALETLLSALHYNLREDFAIPHTALRLWIGQQPGLPEFAAVSTEVKDYAAALSHPSCGPGGHAEAASWFGDAAAHLRSFALIPLRGAAANAQSCIGLLALASEDAMRFYPEMGTVYLKRLGELASAGLSRFL